MTDRTPGVDPGEVSSRAELGRALSAAREAAGLTVRQVVTRSGGPHGTVASWFAGQHVPTARESPGLRRGARGWPPRGVRSSPLPSAPLGGPLSASGQAWRGRGGCGTSTHLSSRRRSARRQEHPSATRSGRRLPSECPTRHPAHDSELVVRLGGDPEPVTTRHFEATDSVARRGAAESVGSDGAAVGERGG